jgi:O-antigen/teichoic acid export membrane protein
MTSTGSVARKLTVGATWNGLAFIFVLSSNLLTVPFVVRSLGLAAFGRAGLVLAVCSILMLIGTIVGQAVVTRASAQLGADDAAGMNRTVTAALRICLIAGPLGWLLVVGLGPLVTSKFTAIATAGSIVPSFVICCTGLLARQGSLVLQSVCVTRQNFKRVAQVTAVSALSDIAFTLAMTHVVPTTNGYLAGLALSSILTLLVWTRVTWPDIHPVAVVTQPLADEVRGLLRFSAWQSMAGLSGIIAMAIDQVVIGAVVSAAALGQYNLASRLQQAAAAGFASCSDVLLPHIARRLAGNADFAQSFQSISWLMGSAGAVLFVPLIALADPLLVLWVGREAADGGAFLLRTLVVWGMFGTASSAFSYYAMASGHVEKLARIALVYSLAIIILTPVFISSFGILGAGFGVVTAGLMRTVLQMATVRQYFFRDLAVRDHVITTILPTGVGLVVGFGLLGLQTPVWRFGRITTVVELAIAFCAIAGGTAVAILIATGLFRCGRAVIGGLMTTLRNEIRAIVGRSSSKQIG